MTGPLRNGSVLPETPSTDGPIPRYHDHIAGCCDTKYPGLAMETSFANVLSACDPRWPQFHDDALATHMLTDGASCCIGGFHPRAIANAIQESSIATARFRGFDMLASKWIDALATSG